MELFTAESAENAEKINKILKGIKELCVLRELSGYG